MQTNHSNYISLSKYSIAVICGFTLIWFYATYKDLYKTVPTTDYKAPETYSFVQEIDTAIHKAEQLYKSNKQEAHAFFATVNEPAQHYARLYTKIGTLLIDDNKFQEAIPYLEKATILNPTSIQAHMHAGFALYKMDNREKALAHFTTVQKLNPTYCQAYLFSSKVLMDDQKFDTALTAATYAVTLEPTNPHTHLQQGHVYNKQGNLPKAINAYQKAVELAPTLANAHYNLGYTFRINNQPEQAISALNKAIELKPNYPDAHVARAQAYISTKQYTQGWEEYEWRWDLHDIQHEQLQKTMWDGTTNLANKTILLYAEQGLGDTFQFIRYALFCKQQGATVYCRVQKPLATILKLCPYIDRIYTKESMASIKADFQTPLMSMPHITKITSDTVPAPIPYLYADQQLVNQWHQRLAHDTNFKIGISWFVDPEHETIKSPVSKRSIPVELLQELATLPGISLYSLQKLDGTSIAPLPANSTIIPLTADCDTSNGRFMDTAALITNLDLIVSVDTSIIHLAAGLGKPVYMVLPYSPDCRWHLNDTTTPWYPTMRIFRQQTPGDWYTPLQLIKKTVAELCINQ